MTRNSILFLYMSYQRLLLSLLCLMEHEQNNYKRTRVVTTVLIVNADYAPILIWRDIAMLLHHWGFDLALTNETQCKNAVILGRSSVKE